MVKTKKTALAGKARRLLRLALFWARKGGVFKCGFVPDQLRLIPVYLLRSLKSGRSDDRIRYGDREFSIDETPIFHFNKLQQQQQHRRPKSSSFRMLLVPCINPPVDFDDDDDIFYGRDCFRGRDDDDDVDCGENCVYNDDDDDEMRSVDCCEGDEEEEEEEEEEEKGIDLKAEEFIARFYQQMKLQRQVSLLEYNERFSSNGMS